MINIKKLIVFIKLELNEQEWIIIENFCKFLEPFNDISELLSSSMFPTCSFILPIISNIETNLVGENNLDSGLIK